MKVRALGNSGIEASAIGLGAWAIGGWMWGGSEEKESIAAIHAAIDAGITLIDTAPIYGYGRSEEVVGKALKGRRDKVVLATKCGMIWDREAGDFAFASDEDWITESGDRAVYKYLGAESIRAEVEQSLQRLQTDIIDLYQPHWPDSTTAAEDTAATLLALQEEGKIRSFGPCNITDEIIRKYAETGPVASVQQKYSMLDRRLEEDALPFCIERHIAVLAYSPMELGLLTGKVTADRVFEDGDLRKRNKKFTPENRVLVTRLLEALEPIAETHEATLAQLVLAWTIHQPGITHALAGARTPAQAEENAGAGALDLSEDEQIVINEAIAAYKRAGGA